MTRQSRLLDALNRATESASKKAADRYGLKFKKSAAKIKTKATKPARKIRAAAE